MGEDLRKLIILEFFHQIDPAKLYFSQEDIRNIQSLPLDLTDSKNESFCSIVQKLESLVKAKLKTADDQIGAKLKGKPNYSVRDSISYLFSNESFCLNSSLVEKRLNRWLKYNTLNRMYQESETKSASALLKVEGFAREKVLLKEKKRIERMVKNDEELHDHIIHLLYKAIALSYDPHSTYFTYGEMRDFENGLSSSLLSFGLDFTEDEVGEASINSIAPGGAAWNSNEIHEGDIIMSIKWNEKEKIDALDYTAPELKDLLELNKNRKVEITVRKKDGSIAIVKLEKNIIDSNENNVHGLLLSGKQKIGYIALPAFYSNWNNQNGKGCAADVASELLKLKKENIGGLILDLRYNGGGSMQEAIELAGIFIDVGPLLLVQPKSEPPITLKDVTRGSIYQGPLLILVNGLSASASELVAATLQDHKRAIVAGTSTFGKASAQNIVPLVDKDTVGYLKITSDKLYRITGKSHQQKGVVPDFLLPDFSDLNGYSEKSYRNALPNDSISKKTYYTPASIFSLPELKKRSSHRVAESNFYKEVSKTKSEIFKSTPLEINEFIHYMDFSRYVMQQIMNREVTQAEFSVSQNQFNQALLQIDNYRREMSNDLIKEIEKSPYIEEAYKILADYINLEKDK